MGIEAKIFADSYFLCFIKIQLYEVRNEKMG